MNSSIIAKRYIDAFVLSVETDKLQSALDAALSISEAIVNDERCFSALKNPLISFEQKNKLLVSVCSKVGVDQKVINFYKVLLRKGRIDVLSRIIEEISVKKQELRNVAIAHVEASGDIDAATTALLQNFLQKELNKDIELNISKSSNLLGGFKVKVGYKIYDFTLENAFEKLRLSFK